MNQKEIRKKAINLIQMHKRGELGGEIMPEDQNPKLPLNCGENYLYFTLPMALNYQRDSYKLWEGAKKTYEDACTNFVFEPKEVLKKDFKEVQEALLKYKVALQPEKQTKIWITLSQTITDLWEGDIRILFKEKKQDVNQIRNFIQNEKRKMFPYLAGNKICNYWLYVLYQYTDVKYANIECLTIAPDTHVIQASEKLGVIQKEEKNKSNIQEIVVRRWEEILKDTPYSSIDMHTPLWLWSRNGFQELKGE